MSCITRKPARRGRIECWRRLAALGVVACCASSAAATAQVPFIRIAKTGDPVPGMPGFTLDYVGMPAIDAAGNLAIKLRMDGPGVGGLNDDAIFHGRPGNLSMIFRESDPVPQFGDGVYQRTLSQPVVAQSGQIGYEAKLDGPGITSSDDDIFWAGPPGSLQVVVREGQAPPGITDGGVFSGNFGSAMGRAGHVGIGVGIVGPDGLQRRGLWTGTSDDPRLVAYSGAPAPGTEPGVTFPSSGVLAPTWTLNARGAMAFPASLEGPGIDGTNNAGIWAGTADDLALVMRAGDPAPVLEPNARFVGFPQYALINGNDRVLFPAFVTGDGITQTNDYGLWAGRAGGAPEQIVREGDEVPLLGAEYRVSDIFPFIQTEDDRVVAVETFNGPDVTAENDQAILFGEPGNWSVLFREGEQAPGLPAGLALDFDAHPPVIAITANAAAGMLLRLAGAGVTEANDEALFWRRTELDPWELVAREGELFDGSIVPDGGLSILPTGGGEGVRPNINDHGDLAFVIRFDGGVSGAYVVPDAGVGMFGFLNLMILNCKRRRSAVDRFG